MTMRAEDHAWYPAWREAIGRVINAEARRIGFDVAKMSQLAAGLLLAGLIGGSPIRAAEPASMVLAEFDYIDSSGEMQDQTQKHAALIADFMEALRSDVGLSSKFRIVPLLCAGQPCAMRGSDPSNLMAAARKAGAKLLLYGGIHKQSTLIQWAKVEVVDLEQDRLIYDRLLSFRGDDANAWRRAERFLAKDLESVDLTQ
jgi:Protein of unknown function (DUF2380)